MRETPGYIPNPEAKPHSADGTAGGTLWESRTPPNNLSEKPRPGHPGGASRISGEATTGEWEMWDGKRGPALGAAVAVVAAGLGVRAAAGKGLDPLTTATIWPP